MLTTLPQRMDDLHAAIGSCSPSLNEHVGNVAALAEAVSRAYGLGEVDVQLIGLAAKLHDVGKVAIPQAILDKPGPLSDAEWTVMHRHTVIGEHIVGSASLPAARLVRSSHERYDGTGYPDGLCAREIAVGARIIAICDAYDAMLSDRVYRRSRSKEEALAELRRCAATQFDPVIVESFCSTIGGATSGAPDRSLRCPAAGVSCSRDDLTKWRTRRETGAQYHGPHGEVAQSPSEATMHFSTKTIALAAALALSGVPAVALPAQVPSNQGAQGASASATPGPKASASSKAKAYGKYCKSESKKHVAGQKGTPFSRCVTAMAKLANEQTRSPSKACKSESKKHVAGQKGTPFSRCVVAGAKLLNHKA